MRLENLEEKSFIKEVLGKYASTAKPELFDDCIVIDLAEFTNDQNAPYLVYSIDHPSFIKRKNISYLDNLEFYGRWAAACTCGDVIAMGAELKGFSFDLSAPLSTTVEEIDSIMKGITQTLEAYGVRFEGGNFDNNNLETVCMAWGIVERDKIIRRKGASEGELVVVTGNVGVGWSGVIAEKMGVLDNLDTNIQKDIETYKLKPLAPYNAMKEVFNEKLITSGMDLSDGLVEFFYNIQYKNNLGVRVDYSKLPLFYQTSKVADKIGVDSKLFAFEPGYDTPITHGWTVKKQDIGKVKEIFAKYNEPVHVYGEVTKEREIRLIHGDKSIMLPEFWDDQFNKSNTVERWFRMIKEIQSQLGEER